MIGKIIQYNKDHQAIILAMNETHFLVQLDTGSKYCINKHSIEINKQ